MLLTPEQLQEIRRIIEDHHDAFIANAIGPDALASESLERLKAKGMIDPKVDSIQDSYLYGQLVAILESAKVAKMGYGEFKRYLARNPIPLSTAEHQAVQMAAMSAAQYCKGLGNTVNLDTGAVLIEADAKLRATTEAGITDAVTLNIARRQSVKALKTDLGWMAKDWARDWDRIAVTEKQTAMLHGQGDSYRKQYGDDVLVAKRPLPGACQWCQKLYLDPNGQPRIFKLSTLEANGTNVGRKAADYRATLGVIHPFCSCALVRIPAGWGFNDEGDLAPDGKLGYVYDDEGDLMLAMRAEDELVKAFKLQGHVEYQGLKIAVENRKGSTRKWKDQDGNTGTTKMEVAYGYLKRTRGADGDEMDCFVGPDPRAENVYVIHQTNPSTGVYDECKCVLGVGDVKEAKKLYDAHYDSPDFFGWIEAMPVDAFKRWIGVTAPTKKEGLQKSHALKPGTNSLLGNAILGSDILERCAFLIKGSHFISWPQAVRLGVAFLAANGQSTPKKGLPDCRLLRSQASGNFTNAMPSIPQGKRLLKIPSTRSPMASPVFSVGQQLQVGDVVVKSIPVAVMHDFGGAEWATKMSLHNDPMLKALAAIHPDKPILCLGVRELTHMAALKFPSHESKHILPIHKCQEKDQKIQPSRLVVPLTKAEVPDYIGAATSPAGNRAPGPGIGANYVFLPRPKRDKNKTRIAAGAKELVEPRDSTRDNPLKRDKADYEIGEDFRVSNPLVIPEDFAGGAEARKKAKANLRYVLGYGIKNVMRPKNTAEIETVRTPVLE